LSACIVIAAIAIAVLRPWEIKTQVKPAASSTESASDPADTSSSVSSTAAASASMTGVLKVEKVAIPDGYLADETAGYTGSLAKEGKTLQQDKEDNVEKYFGQLTKLRDALPDADEPGEKYTGQTIYTGILKIQDFGQEKGTIVNYIISGSSIMNVNKPWGEDPWYKQELYDENTGKRIYIVATQEELDAAKQDWQAGQDILNGNTTAPANSIIIDGRLIQGASFTTDENGNVILPMAAIIEQLYTRSNVTDNGIMNVVTNGYKNTQIAYSVPNQTYVPTEDDGQDIQNGTFGAQAVWNSSEILWNQQLPLAEGTAYNWPAWCTEAWFNWSVYTDGNTVVIVTDPMNYSDTFLVENESNVVYDVLTGKAVSEVTVAG
jgi:hypothetical protein